ncbi:gliding motility protein GldN [Mucilaginibacter sp. HMF5004]|uniref:type IX secretion system ring protein PorN/GldN n=1 Tax=Mucilaginibacter rivuli TaxID=2857527 RepID=UPI001C5DFED3|nr:gliding motility protein GldN [Mucilaginibacter rivuli]MBW4890243.1 gliding motility protein GldN [Mucilaginibacter rivuli]
MKKRILLIVVLGFLSTAVFAQAKKKAPVKKKPVTTKSKTTAAKPAAGKANTSLNGKANDASNKPTIAVTQIPLTDTVKKDRPLNGFYVKSNILSAKPTPYAVLREADVVFEKTIWREIDLRERVNQYLISPKKRLIDVLVNAIKNDELTVYDPTPTKIDVNGDEFTAPLTKEKALARLSDSTLVHHFDAAGTDIGTTMVPGEFNPDSVIKFRIKELWMFDKQRSVFEPRILGIAPLVKPKVTGAGEADYQPAFWIYYPEARKILAAEEAVLKHNDATGLSFDQVLLKRIFTSYIVKQSNEKDERIKDYAQGLDKLYESERIKKSLMDWELELWKYGN